MNDFDLENMRQQMATLKKKLDHQEIINDRIMRKSMKKNVSSINRRYYMIMALALFMIPYGYWVFIKLTGFSMAFYIATCVLMLISAVATYYNGMDLRDDNLMKNDLIEARQKVARAKKLDAQWLLIGIPLAIAWLVWFIYEVNLQDGSDSYNGLLYGGVIGGILGAIIGLKIHTKTQRQYQEIIDQIEDLTEE